MRPSRTVSKPGQKAAIGLVARDRAADVQHPGNHVGRSDPCAENLEIPHHLDTGVRGYGRYQPACPDPSRCKRAQQVTGNNAPRGIGDHRPVGVAIGRHYGVKPVVGDPARQHGLRRGVQRFGIDRNEPVRAAKRNRIGPQCRKNRADDVAGGGAVFIDTDPQAGQRARTEVIGVARCIKPERFEALARAGDAARGGTAYVSLEPCCVAGKTGPCTEALGAAGVARVVYAARDPNPDVAGAGARALGAAGIQVDGPVLPEEGATLLTQFEAALGRDRPWVIAKWAMTLDGAIAPRQGVGGRITGNRASRHTHLLRAHVDAIAVGIGTVQADDPALTCRLASGLPEGREAPTRVVFDPQLVVPARARLVQDAREVPTLVFSRPDVDPGRVQVLADAGVDVVRVPPVEGGIDLAAACRLLHARGVRRLLVEGGSTIHGAMLEAGLVDQITAWVAPRIFGGTDAVPAVRGTSVEDAAGALVLDAPVWKRVGDDLLLQGYVPT